MIRAGIIGATGYAGNELVRLLTGHPEVEISFLASKSYEGERYSDIYRNFTEVVELDCVYAELPEMVKKADVIFTATPQGFLAGCLTKELLNESVFIDLSADYRLKDVAVYEKWYGITHRSPELLEEAVYGLSEIHREKIKKTRLVANPGCYTTCSILTAYPLVKEHLIDPSTLIVNALSGVSGAGRGAKTANLFCEVNENAKAYAVTTHRHTPEIEEQLGEAFGGEIKINFTPHLVPLNRGILVTETADLTDGAGEKDIREAFEAYYGKEYFIRLPGAGVCPESRYVEGSNFADISYKVDERTNRVVLMGTLDNLVKGAAGQAVQNMNLVFGFDERSGIDMLPMVP